jgi:hypothetical protein
MAHAVDLFVDGRILLDIGVGTRDVGLGLVIVVIGDEIFDCVLREEAFELAIELRRERLVRSEDEGRALRRLNHLRHGEGLARAGDAEQHLVLLQRIGRSHQLGNGVRLVAFRLQLGLNLQGHAAFALFRARRPMRQERRERARHQRVILHQGLRSLAESGRPAVGSCREAEADGLPRNGARLGAAAERSRNAVRHISNMAAAGGLG